MRGILKMDIVIKSENNLESYDVKIYEICTQIDPTAMFSNNKTDYTPSSLPFVSFADDVSISKDGSFIYFTDASTRFSPKQVDKPWYDPISREVI